MTNIEGDMDVESGVNATGLNQRGILEGEKSKGRDKRWESKKEKTLLNTGSLEEWIAG